jgi:hypothetical protein
MKWKKNYEEFGVRGAGGGTLGDIGGVSGAVMMFCSKNTRVYSHSLTP